MKALLKFGIFTAVIDVADEQPTIYIPHPEGMLTMSDTDYGEVTATTASKRLEFDYYSRDRLDDVEILVYRYMGIK